MKNLLLILSFLAGLTCYAEKGKVSEAHGLQKLDLPDLKTAEVCLATTQDSNGDRMDWLLTCLDSKRRFLLREKRIATEKPAGEDEMTYGDLELTVEMQGRGFRLASTQDGLFFTRK